MISMFISVYNKGYLVLLYDQASEPLREDKFNPMWYCPYIVRSVLENGSYNLEDYERNVLKDPRNRLYLKM